MTIQSSTGEEELTLDHIAEVLFDTIRPFYRGLPAPGTTTPEFRKSLTGEEANALLLGIHHTIAMIVNRDDSYDDE